VWADPRGVAALKAQGNPVRRFPSYEARPAKYFTHGFEVSVPDLKREDADPIIFINRIEGLAKLLVLEKLSNPDDQKVS
jgi:hypothetical protein